MSKQILYGDDARRALEVGVSKLAKSIKTTIGPKGRNAVLERKYSTPLITNDGVTIARDIELPNPFENMGAALIKEVSIKTNDIAGDGTTTAVILAEAIVHEGVRNIVAGANPIILRKGMERALDLVVRDLKRQSRVVASSNEISQVASVSAGSEEIGQLIADALQRVGSDGVITVQEGNTANTFLSVVEGMQFERGFISPYMVTNPEKMEAVIDNPLILITDKKISSIQEILPLLEQVIKENRKLFIISEDLEGDALSTLILNKLRGSFSVLAVKAPSFGDNRREILEDIAIITGGKVISSDAGYELSKCDISMLGSAKQVRVDKENTTIVQGDGESTFIEQRINTIKLQIENADSNFEKEKLQERLAKLAGGVAVINVGSFSEVELKEKKLRIEDALHATKAANKEGIVAGGGVALLSAIKPLNEMVSTLMGDEKLGAEIIAKALEEPIKQIAENSGTNGNVVVEKIRETSLQNFGYDALSDRYVDMFEVGIIDPTKVSRCALEHAVSVASTLLTTETLISDIPQTEKAQLPIE